MQTNDQRVDECLAKFLECRGKKPNKGVQLAEEDVKYLITESKKILMEQPNLIELEAPIKICGKYTVTSNPSIGDVHG